MELRSSSRQRSEYKELKITLNGMGFYEEDMELQEMRQIIDALQMSVNEEETNFLDCDMQQAIRESELDFMPSQDDRVLNSTMMSIHPNISPCISPEIPSERFVVYAEVHHAMDWSPSNRKRFASPNIAFNNENISPEVELINELLEPDAKRMHDIHDKPIDNIKIEEENTNMEISFNNLENSLQEPTNSSHEIHGHFSVRRIHDSGLNMSNKIAHSTFNSTTSNELSSTIHEVHGPMSVRRIHDSGVNISCGISNASGNYNNSNENSLSNHFFENSEQVSTSSAVNHDFGDDSELSI